MVIAAAGKPNRLIGLAIRPLAAVSAAAAFAVGWMFSAVPSILLPFLAVGVAALAGMAAARRGRFRVSAALVTPGLLLTGYALCWPTGLHPLRGATRLPSPAGQGVFATNDLLASAVLIEAGPGPECIAIGEGGRIYTGLADGRVVRLSDNGSLHTIASTGGRPLGIEFDAGGNLIIADARAGLLSLSPEGELTTLATHAAGTPIRYADDLAIAADGRVFFSDASRRHPHGSEDRELFEHRPTGRLLVYDPATSETSVLVDRLHFANGVALAADESFVLAAETYEHRLTRYWLTGPKAGTTDVFAQNLPGYPDNVTTAPGGGFWVAIVSPRSPLMDAWIDRPFKRLIVWRLSRLTGLPQPRHSYAVLLDANGGPLRSLECSSGEVHSVTSVLEHNGTLYFGSHQTSVVGVLELEPTEPDETR